jgi:hypothetical protein
VRFDELFHLSYCGPIFFHPVVRYLDFLSRSIQLVVVRKTKSHMFEISKQNSAHYFGFWSSVLLLYLVVTEEAAFKFHPGLALACAARPRHRASRPARVRGGFAARS